MSERLYTVRVRHHGTGLTVLVDHIAATEDERAGDAALRRLKAFGLDPFEFAPTHVEADPVITDLEIDQCPAR